MTEFDIAFAVLMCGLLAFLVWTRFLRPDKALVNLMPGGIERLRKAEFVIMVVSLGPMLGYFAYAFAANAKLSMSVFVVIVFSQFLLRPLVKQVVPFKGLITDYDAAVKQQFAATFHTKKRPRPKT
jgi:hypothetical protein